jgi:uncharacterized protein
MAPRLHALRLNPVELLRQPGAERQLHAVLSPAELELDDPRIAGDVTVDLHAVSSIDGVVVRGSVATPWHDECRRCLTAVSGVAAAEVDELYQYEAAPGAGVAGDANQIEGDHIDLAPVVREYVLLELPDAPLCRPDCAGICPVCGIDRNTATCSCDTEVRDDRWSVLDQLKFDE